MHLLQDNFEESLLPVLIHLDDLVPILGDFVQSLTLRQVDQCQQVLPEAASAETHTTIDELVSDSGVSTDTPLDFSNISSNFFYHKGNAVDT